MSSATEINLFQYDIVDYLDFGENNNRNQIVFI